MPIEQLPIYAYYNKQRFTQAGSMDAANFYAVAIPDGKQGQALYPTMGRQHIRTFNENKLIFDAEPRFVFRSINFVYIVVSSQVFRVDKNFQATRITSFGLEVQPNSPVWFDYLPVGDVTYCMFADGTSIFVAEEQAAGGFTWQKASGTGVPPNPEFIAAFGNRFIVNSANTPNWYLSNTNLGATPSNPATWFDITAVTGGSLFNRATGIIRQLAVLHNQLYIFTDFSCDIWSNIPTQINVAGFITEFPFKLNSSYNWDYGMADPFSLDVDFGRMVWLAKNRNGLVTFMTSNGQQPQPISTQAINVLLERDAQNNQPSPFLSQESDGFLYQWENTIFYRVAAGRYMDFGVLDLNDSANAIEYNFDTQTWHRVIELNGERSRIQKHVFFENKHLVTVEGDNAIYEMAGNLYFNELLNPNQSNRQADDAFLKYPMRYELVTQQIYKPDYSEFITDYVEIDFVFGDQTFYKDRIPFDNTIYLVTEESTDENPIYIVTEESTEESPVYVIAEEGNTPEFNDNHYYDLFKPHIELYWSDDGGVTFQSADLREFSNLGVYRWRMRWYELGPSRNRCYRLVCVSSAPIVILGAVQNTRRASGGAN